MLHNKNNVAKQMPLDVNAADATRPPGGGAACVADRVPLMYSKKDLTDIEQWSRTLAPTSSRGGLVLA